MWETTIDGRVLHFHLAGINNQNFIMRDDETGSWWQQVTGEAIFGPLKGKHLTPVFLDELTFATWKHEDPQGRVLRLIVVMSEDGQSVRAFERKVEGVEREFFLKPNSSPLRLIDDQGTEWDFTGTALNGNLAGKQLMRIPVLKDYWFDWKTYNPNTSVYTLGDR